MRCCSAEVRPACLATSRLGPYTEMLSETLVAWERTKRQRATVPLRRSEATAHSGSQRAVNGGIAPSKHKRGVQEAIPPLQFEAGPADLVKLPV